MFKPIKFIIFCSCRILDAKLCNIWKWPQILMGKELLQTWQYCQTLSISVILLTNFSCASFIFSYLIRYWTWLNIKNEYMMCVSISICKINLLEH